jgi:hypothetical protein
MKYMLLIHEPAEAVHDSEMFGKHEKFAESIGRRGQLVDGAALSDVSVATTVRFSDGEVLITDGPHAETKEHLGGYYIVNCADLDEALDIAALVPVVPDGCVEVRPVVER